MQARQQDTHTPHTQGCQMAVIPYPHPPPCVCRASTGFCWTITAYTVLSSAGMAQGFAGLARLLPDALRVALATGLCVHCHCSYSWDSGYAH